METSVNTVLEATQMRYCHQRTLSLHNDVVVEVELHGSLHVDVDGVIAVFATLDGNLLFQRGFYVDKGVVAVPVDVICGILMQIFLQFFSLGLEPLFCGVSDLFKSVTDCAKDIFHAFPEVVPPGTCGRVVLHSQQMLGQISAVDVVFGSIVTRQCSLVASGTFEGDGHRVQHVVLVDVAGCVLRCVVLQGTCAGRCRVGVDVELGAHLYFLVVSCQNLSNRRLCNVQYVAVAFQLLLGSATQISAVFGMIPDAHRVAQKRLDAQLVGQRLVDGDLSGVGVEDGNVIARHEVVE